MVVVRHSGNELCDGNDVALRAKSGMKTVCDLLDGSELASYYKLLMHIHTPMDFRLKAMDADERNTKNAQCVSQHKHSVLFQVKPNAKDTCIVKSDRGELSSAADSNCCAACGWRRQ